MNAIEIDYACTGSIIPAGNFTATGTWSLDASGSPNIVCTLTDQSTGVQTNSGGTPSPSSGTSGTWSAPFNIAATSDLFTLAVSITGTAASDDQADLAFQNNPPLLMSTVPAPYLRPRVWLLSSLLDLIGWSTTDSTTVSGTYTVGVGIAIVCIAALDRKEKLTSILATTVATMNAGAATWTATLSFDASGFVAGDKVTIFAVLLNHKGRIVGRVGRHGPPK